MPQQQQKKKKRRSKPTKRAGTQDRTVEVAYLVLAGQFRELMSNEAGARADRKARPLHDMRVATRRLRTALRVFAVALPPGRVKTARSQLKWIGKGLGPARDLDVQIARLRKGFLPDGRAERRAKRGFAGWLSQRRSEARTRMLAVLDSGRFGRFAAGFARFLRKGPPRNPRTRAARRPVGSLAAELIPERLETVLRAGREMTHCRRAADLHRFRLECKRARYLCEFLRGIYGAPAERTIARLTAVQNALGSLQDSLVGQALLAGFTGLTGEAGGALAADERACYSLAAWYLQAAEQSRRAFAPAWREFEKPGHRRELLGAVGRNGG